MTTPRDDQDEFRGAKPLPMAGGVGAVLVVAGDCRLVGWSFIESSGLAPAQFDIHDGQGAGSTPVAVEFLTAGASVTRPPGNRGVQINSGLTVAVNSGAIRGAVYVIDN